jgi:hypothetical protein
MAAKTKEITPIQYAEYYGCFPTYIQRLLRDGKYDKLPNVIKVRKYSRFWTLEVPKNLTESDFKEKKVRRHP